MTQTPLLRDQSLPHAWNGGDQRQRVRVIGVVDPVCQLNPVRPDALAVDLHLCRFRQSGDRIGVTRVETAIGRDPRDGAVHQATVDERKAQCFGDPLTDGRFTGSHATVDGDNHFGLLVSTARWSAEISASPSTRHPPSFSRPSFNGPKPTRFSDWTLWPMK